jgi:16S rRNA (cytidine1402-2'-O)-methyltransferase
MTAGRGIVHSEMPAMESGLLSGFQLWVNLPAREKLCPPGYQDLAPRMVREGRLCARGSAVRVIAGEVDGLVGPVRARPTRPTLVTLRLEDDRPFELRVPARDAAFAFVHEGSAELGPDGGSTRVDEGMLAVLGPGRRIRVQARERIVVYVSDAGMPGIADPGAELVAAARQAGIAVTVVPGPSAIATAIALSGLPAEPFLILGFLPPKTGPRARRLMEFRDVAASLVAFEAPHRLAETLAAMAEILGPRPAAVAREMTKRFEECRLGTLDELAAHYRDQPALGEIVLVIGPPLAAAKPGLDDAAVRAKLEKALASLGVRDAADRVAAETGLPRRPIYAAALALAGKSGTGKKQR